MAEDRERVVAARRAFAPERRSRRFEMMMSDGDHARIKAIADGRGVSMARLLQESALSESYDRRERLAVIAALDSANRLLANIAGNINQLAHHANVAHELVAHTRARACARPGTRGSRATRRGAEAGQVIPNISRGGNMAELLSYLYGPGKADEHERAHMVAASQHEATLHKPLGETLTEADVRPRTEYLEERRRLHEKVVKRWLNDNGEVVAAPKNGRPAPLGVSRRAAHVWHCSMSLAPGERLSDEQWGRVAGRFTQLMGFYGADEFRATLAAHPALEEPLMNLAGWDARKRRMNFGAIRWEADHHGLNAEGLDHIHIAAEVVSDNGNVWEDVYDERRAQIAAGIIEREFGLQLVDGHQHDRGQQGYKKGELEHDKRMGRDVGQWANAQARAHYIDKTTARPERGARRLLERTVRACAVAAGDELDFVRRVRHEGVEIEGVTYDRGRGRGRITGYRVRLPGSESERWYGGGHIAKDLTLPALRAAGNWPRLDGDQAAAWRDATTARSRRGIMRLSPRPRPHSPSCGSG